MLANTHNWWEESNETILPEPSLVLSNLTTNSSAAAVCFLVPTSLLAHVFLSQIQSPDSSLLTGLQSPSNYFKMPIPQVWVFFSPIKKYWRIPRILRNRLYFTFSTGKVSVPWSIKSQTGEHKTGCHRDWQTDSGIVDTKIVALTRLFITDQTVLYFTTPSRVLFYGYTCLPTYMHVYHLYAAIKLALSFQALNASSSLQEDGPR